MQQVKEKIDDMPAGQLITYSQFQLAAAEFGALAAALSRLARQGVITRYGKGHYFKPKETLFGSLKPQESDVIASLVHLDKGNVMYEGGIGLYNRLGLTTQIPKAVTLVTRPSQKTLRKRSVAVGNTKITITERPVIFNKSDIPQLEILDAFRGIKKIPATSVDETCRILLRRLAGFQLTAILRLAELAQTYNPATIALTGALLEFLGFSEAAKPLRKKLNPLSQYRLGMSEQVLPNKKNWRII